MDYNQNFRVIQVSPIKAFAVCLCMHNLSTRTNTSSLPPESSGGKKVKFNIVKAVEVYCRFRPIGLTEHPSPYYLLDTDQNCVDLNAPDEILKKNQGIKKYKFTRVFSAETDQETVYLGTVGDMVQSLLVNRKNGLVYSYGVTNAGKTHTIIGDKTCPGVLPRILERLISVKSAVEAKEFPPSLGLSEQEQAAFRDASGLEIDFECFEIYNEDIHDLMTEVKKTANGKLVGERPKLKFREIKDKKTIIEDLSKVRLSCIAEAHETINRCLKNRQVANTLLNSSSSRSHTIFRMTVSLVYDSPNNQKVLDLLGYLCVVDLAGSERAKRTETTDDRMKEACGINNSLLVLGRCLQALKKGQMVPFRDCKLTRFLADYFLSECSMKMITNINPREEDFEESLRVLNYSSVAKETKIIVSEFRTARLESATKQTRLSIQSIPSIVPETYRESALLSRTEKEICQERLAPTSRTGQWTKRNKMDEEDRQYIVDEVLKGIEKQMDEQMKRMTEHLDKLITEKMGTKAGNRKGKSWLEQFRSTMSQDTGKDSQQEISDKANLNVFHRQRHPRSSDKAVKRPPKGLSIRASLKRANSDDEKNFEAKNIRKLKIRASNDMRLSDKESTRQQKHREVSMNEANQLETPQRKINRSSFYTSLLKEPQVSWQTVEAVSMREHERERRKRYLFMLDLCGNNHEEAGKFYRQEYNESPPID